ncbi:MAG: UDP-3-O-(3-hydroxymyristoyl)glucosamine N-acyltransferase [Flavobacteriales bacterium]|nr:UDP-3-O-(3-hydroxymyristoyl)glucosamine N-acyltransferase [Flavobacteriales bacterium]
MTLDPPKTLSQIAAIIGCEYEGDPVFPVSGINEIHRVIKGDLVFVDHPKYYDKALSCAATTILINQKVTAPEGKSLIFSDDPFRDYNKLTKHFSPWKMSEKNVGENSVVSEGSRIHPSAVIGNDVHIGKGCIIYPGVVIYDRTWIGDNVIIHANSVIGADAFYYKTRPEGREKMHSCGNVVIEDHVEIGALCSIDKGVSAETRIGAGTKMDDHVHVGHDTLIGRNCLFAAQVGLAGCVTIDEDVILWGQVGVVSNVHIGKGAVVLGQSGISKDLEPGKTYFGSPAEEAREKFRELAMIRKIPEIIGKLNL